ncbi:VC0807 family protein [Streptomyces sp. NPDC001941]|uniref:VC0807 family protein n=1 Tax=Streptomyces sp. NPDC001941 TaxID=3154659 RepID=UPI00332C3A7A
MNSSSRTRNPLLQSLMPLILDAGVPMAAYYLLKAAGMETFGALALSSVIPALRTLWSVVRDRRLNRFAALILIVNVVSIALSAVSGDPRLMLAKDSGISSVVGLGIILSTLSGRPLMTTALKPWITRGSAARTAAWDRLLAGDERFRRAERRFSLVWGAALFIECVVRVVGAYTLPVDTMVALGSVIMAVTIAAAIWIAGALAAGPMVGMVAHELASSSATEAEPTPEPVAGATAPTLVTTA